MLKNEKKKTKTETQKEIEGGQDFEGLFENFSEKKLMDLQKFIAEFLDLDNADSNLENEDGAKVFELIGKGFDICTLAWGISQASGTYEKSIQKLNSLPWNEVNLTTRMGAKFLLIRALRIKFSLPSDKKSVIQAAKDVWTSEELKCFYEKPELSGPEAAELQEQMAISQKTS
ncbi:MAG: hypothetical protein PHH77_06435 [Victivallaceae bacterium]|nr:hypothetical protein [Victivallaceae bacterium]